MEFTRKTIRALIGEFVCTWIFIFSVCAVGLNNSKVMMALGPTAGGIVTAFVAVAIIYSFGGISGAHFNPAVTVGAMIGCKIGLVQGILYIVVQLLAALLAVGVLSLLFPASGTAASLVLSPGKDATSIEAVAMEFCLTFILVLVIYATAMGVRTTISNGDIETAEEAQVLVAENKQRMNFAPIAIGFTIGFLCFLGGSVSGGAFNPARATAPALIAWEFGSLWIYWVGDVTGAAAAACLFHFYFERG